MRPVLPLAFALVAALSAPAIAVPACSGSFALDSDDYTEDEINDFNLRLLQSRGVDATRAEIWGGCIRAFVRTSDGREEMQFFEPLNMRRVE